MWVKDVEGNLANLALCQEIFKTKTSGYDQDEKWDVVAFFANSTNANRVTLAENLPNFKAAQNFIDGLLVGILTREKLKF